MQSGGGGFKDCFKDVKDQENEKSLALLPGVLAELDQRAPYALNVLPLPERRAQQQ